MKSPDTQSEFEMMATTSDVCLIVVKNLIELLQKPPVQFLQRLRFTNDLFVCSHYSSKAVGIRNLFLGCFPCRGSYYRNKPHFASVSL